MGVLRMIKLFGWESRVRENIAEKREHELRFIWKKKILGMVNNIAKYVVWPSCPLLDVFGADILTIHSATQSRSRTWW